jgi:sulfotransferase family protein
MIGQHPELAGLPELKPFSYRTVGELEASLPSYWIERGFTHRSPGLVRALAQLEFGGQTAETLAASQAWLRQRGHWSGADVLDVLMGRLVPRIAVEKSPENVTTASALRRLSSAYPEARYLHLVRHPATTQASMAEHLLRTVPEHPRLGEPMAGIAVWCNIHARIVRFGATLPGDRILRVRAEDVLNDASAQLRAIASWLRLRTDDAAIEAMCHPEASPFARFGPPGSGIIGGYDHDFLRDPIRAASAFPRQSIHLPAGRASSACGVVRSNSPGNSATASRDPKRRAGGGKTAPRSIRTQCARSLCDAAPSTARPAWRTPARRRTWRDSWRWIATIPPGSRGSWSKSAGPAVRWLARTAHTRLGYWRSTPT